MSSPLRKVVTGVVFFLLVCAVAVCGYVAAGWNFMDSIYMVIITIFGVGYGEVQPIQSTPLRALTIMVIVAGYGAVIYTIGGFMQMLVDGEINRALGARRMSKGIDRMEDHTIICGFGRVGSILATELAKANRSFVVIDQDGESIKEAEAQGIYVLGGDATEEEVLIRAGIHRARSLATVLSDDAANVFITITARDLSPHLEIIARAENPATERKLIRSGASKVVLPAAIGAARMAHLIVRPTTESMLDDVAMHASLKEEFGKIGLQLDELQVRGNSPLVGQTVGNIEIKGNLGFLVVAIKKLDNTVLNNPSETTVLSAGDTVIVLGHKNDIPQLIQRYALKREVTYRGAKIQT